MIQPCGFLTGWADVARAVFLIRTIYRPGQLQGNRILTGAFRPIEQVGMGQFIIAQTLCQTIQHLLLKTHILKKLHHQPLSLSVAHITSLNNTPQRKKAKGKRKKEKAWTVHAQIRKIPDHYLETSEKCIHNKTIVTLNPDLSSGQVYFRVYLRDSETSSE